MKSSCWKFWKWPIKEDAICYAQLSVFVTEAYFIFWMSSFNYSVVFIIHLFEVNEKLLIHRFYLSKLDKDPSWKIMDTSYEILASFPATLSHLNKLVSVDELQQIWYSATSSIKRQPSLPPLETGSTCDSPCFWTGDRFTPPSQLGNISTSEK